MGQRVGEGRHSTITESIIEGTSAPLPKMQQLVIFHKDAAYAVPHAYSAIFRAWYKFM